MGRQSKAHKGPQRNEADGQGVGEIRHSPDTRTSGSVYLSDLERDTLRAAAGTKNLSKAVQWAARLFQDILK